MKYVVDASVAFKWVVVEIDDDKANRLREGYRNGTHELLAPDIFSAEVAVPAEYCASSFAATDESRFQIPGGHVP
jgi:predicted nucleic acid-binding protein